MINLIASTGQNRELGKNGKLIWPIKDDLRYFRSVTIDHDIIMGRKTFESLPKLLDRRHHIVLTRNKIDNIEVEVENNIKALIARYKDIDAFVIGGASIYKQFIDYAENIYLTEIEATCEQADAYFPNFDKEKYIKEIIKENYDDKNNLKYNYVLYKRRH